MTPRRTYAVVVLMVILAAGVRIGLERSLLLRALVWMDADMGDINRFPSNEIETGDGEFVFFSATAGRYDSVLQPLRVPTGADESELRDLESFLEERDTYAFLMIRRDTLVYERYFQGRDGGSVETTFSVSKSVLSLAVGVAVQRGWLTGVGASVTDLVPELASRDPRFDAVTLEHLLTMTSGIDFTRSKTPWGDEARSYYHPNLRSVALTRDLRGAPPQDFQYNYYNPIVLGLALERAAGMSLSQLLAQHVWPRIGASETASWSVDSRTHRFEKMESGFNAAAIDLAKIGRLYLREGDWDGERILPAEWVRASVRSDSTAGRSPRYGYFWWLTNPEEGQTQYYAEGRFGQFIFVAPEQGLIIVRTGKTDGDMNWRSVFDLFVTRIEAHDRSRIAKR